LTVAVTAACGLGAIPAQADSGPTTATFTINGGTLTMTTPDTVNLGMIAAGTSRVSGALGVVTVSDQRAALNGAWTASVIATAFTTGAGGAGKTIPATDISYAPGTPTTTSGTGTFAPGAGGAADTLETAFTATAETGATSCSWNPTITVTLPGTVAIGTYTGTITHSVA
jgi:hypothetical protein